MTSGRHSMEGTGLSVFELPSSGFLLSPFSCQPVDCSLICTGDGEVGGGAPPEHFHLLVALVNVFRQRRELETIGPHDAPWEM